jgi:hypothetical protein
MLRSADYADFGPGSHLVEKLETVRTTRPSGGIASSRSVVREAQYSPHRVFRLVTDVDQSAARGDARPPRRI